MLAYIVRRLLLIIPTLFGIMILNFVIVQAAPGGPVEQAIAQITGIGGGAVERVAGGGGEIAFQRSEEHTSELQSLMRISYAVFCLKKKINALYKTHYN